jgi:hypothetical protein
VYGVVGYTVILALIVGVSITFLQVILAPIVQPWGSILTPEIGAIEASKEREQRWVIVQKLAGVTVASTVIIFGSIALMGWNMDRATKRMWNRVQPSDEVIAMELAVIAGDSDIPGPTSTPVHTNLTAYSSTSGTPSGSSPTITLNHSQSSAHGSEGVDTGPGSLDRAEVMSPKVRGKRRAVS